MITQKSIDAVIEASRIEEVVRDFVDLKRSGVNLSGLCPFHSEKTPSFSVSPSKNIFKCFGCGKGGDSVHFLMEYEQISFVDAIRKLADKFNVPIEETTPSPEYLEQQQQEESLFLVNQFARDFFVHNLWETSMGKSVGLSYFTSRGFSEEIIRKFQLGYAPDKGDALLLEAVQKGYDKQTLEALGLCSDKGRDFFRGRAMFAIHNASGKVIGFGGRILNNTIKAPKYINTPETEVYHKSEVLYGLYFAKKAIRKADQCILVEGYTDVVSLHQAGIENVVAASGTSLTEEQVRLIKRHTRQALVLFDGDQAGIKAAQRGLNLLLEEGMNVRVALLPEGEDPDSYVKSLGGDAFKTFLEDSSQDFILYNLSLIKDTAADDPVKKAAMVRDLVRTISLIPDSLQRSIYVRQTAEGLGLDEQLIVQEVNRDILQARQKQQNRQSRQNGFDTPEDIAAASGATTQPGVLPVPQSHEYQEKDIIRILINFGDRIVAEDTQLLLGDYLLDELKDVIDSFENATYKEVVHYYEELRKTTIPEFRHFTSHRDRKISQLAVDLLSSPYQLSENWEKKWEIYLQTQKAPDENFVRDSHQALLRFKLKKVIRSCDDNQQFIEQYTKEGNSEKIILHLKVQKKLIELRNEIAQELGTVVL
jgi:DNA primase